MDSTAVSRRAFLGSSAGLALGLSLAGPAPSRGATHHHRSGVLYGTAGRRGIPPAGAAGPARGDVLLLDGTTIAARHGSRHPIAPGKGVLLSPDGDGEWSVLYAEF